jgi:YVTN family beta-propeller protein
VRTRLLVAAACVASFLVAVPGSVAAGPPLTVVGSVALPGAANRFDYLSLDPATRKLYVAHMDDDHIVVVDVRTRRVLRTIAAPGVHGVLAVSRLGRVFATATDARQLLTIDAATGAVLRHAAAGDYPDGIAWDPAERRVYVSDESGGETVFDAGGRRVATVELGGDAGNVQYDAAGRRILVAVQSRDEVAVVDPVANRVVRRIPLAGCDGSHGLLVDSARRLAFVACAGNARLLTLDLRRLRVVASAGVGQGPDVLGLDTSLHRLYVAAESGEVAVFAEGARGLRTLGQGLLAPAAHSLAVDPRTHLVYVPLERGRGGQPELRIFAPRR